MTSRHRQPSPSPDARRSRGRARVRTSLASIGGLVLLASVCAGGAVAAPGVGPLPAAKAARPLSGTITRTAPAEGTTSNDGSGGLTSTPTDATTTPTDATTTPAPVAPVQTPAVEGPLVVTMTATPQVVTVGQTVTYVAQVSGVPPGKQVLYHWAFEGGTGVGEEITRTYPDAGEYPVAVTVTVASVAGLSGVADALTVVVSDSPPSKVPGSGSSATGGGGSGSGKGGGGAGSSKTAHSRTPTGKADASQGVADPLPAQSPSAQAGQQVEGFLLSDAGVPFSPVSSSPTSASSSGGGSDLGSSGVGSAAGIGGGVALTIAIVTLGALDERRRISLRNA